MKSTMLRIRVSPEQMTAYREQAERAHKGKVSAWVRHVLWCELNRVQIEKERNARRGWKMTEEEDVPVELNYRITRKMHKKSTSEGSQLLEMLKHKEWPAGMGRTA